MTTGELDPDGLGPFDDFVQTSRPRLRRLVTRLLGRHLVGHLDVDDLVQIAHEDVLLRWDEFDNEVAAHSYGERIVRNQANNARRDAARRSGAWLQGVHHAQQQQAPPADEAVLPLLGVSAALSAPGLTDEQRRAVVLVDVEDLAIVEAAAILGTTHASVKGLLRRGRKCLREEWVAPGLSALLPRWRRPGVATVAVAAPTLAVALSLAVLDTPRRAEANTPRVSAHVGWLLPSSTPAPALAEPADASSPAPVRDDTSPSSSPPASSSPSPSATLPLPVPGGGACVGETCAGDQLGDRVCVRTGQEDFDPACANQGYVGVCSVTPQSEYASCQRDTEPMVDPTQPPPP